MTIQEFQNKHNIDLSYYNLCDTGIVSVKTNLASNIKDDGTFIFRYNREVHSVEDFLDIIDEFTRLRFIGVGYVQLEVILNQPKLFYFESEFNKECDQYDGWAKLVLDTICR